MDYIVVIPSCNRYDYLVAAVRSALAQTLPPRAVWVVDDASTDSRYRIAAELADPLVRLIRRPVNSKAATASTYAIGTTRNTALVELLATPFVGWVAFLDDDDVWRPEKMEATADVAAAHPDAAAIGTDATVVNPAGDPIGFYGWPVGASHTIQVEPGLLDASLAVAHVNPMTTSTVAMPMRVVRQIGLMRPVGYCEDWDYWHRAAGHGRLLRITRDLALYRKGHRKEWTL